MPRLREKFLKENKGKWVKLIFTSGYQLNCSIVDYDEEAMEVATRAYNPTSLQNVIVPYAAVATYVPSKD